MKLSQILDRLEKLYGKPSRVQPTDPYQMLLHRNCGYPQSDLRCDKGFRALKENVGLLPAEILAMLDARLTEILRGSGSGMIPELRARRLKEIAARVQTDFAGSLREVLRGTPAEARKALKRFPTIGDSGADKILLFSGTSPAVAIPANCVRVPLRLAFGQEKNNYAASYRAAQDYVASELPRESSALQRAYLLLKMHGEKLCKNTKPLCQDCPVSSACAYFKRSRA
jgi:endonuclease-3